jgi:hypothetical protein
VGPRAGLDAVEKRQFLPLLGIEPRPFRSPSLYRLSYPDSVLSKKNYFSVILVGKMGRLCGILKDVNKESEVLQLEKQNKKRGFGPLANYSDRATAAC